MSPVDLQWTGFKQWLSAANERLVPSELAAEQVGSEVHNRALLLTALTAVSAGLYGAVGVFLALTCCLAHGAAMVGFALLVGATLLIVLRTSKSVKTSANLFLFYWFAALVVGGALRGGVGAPPILAAGAAPALAILLVGIRSSLFWGLMAALQLAVFVGLDAAGIALSDTIAPGSRLAASTAGALAFLGVMVFVAAGHDKLMRRALERSRAREAELRALVHGLPDSIVRLDGSCQLIGYTSAEPIAIFGARASCKGQTLAGLFPEYPGAAEAAWLKARRCGGADLEVTIRGTDAAVDLDLRFSADGKTDTILVARDVTERNRIRAQLRAAERIRVDRMASVGQLAAGVAHEINNPLAYIVANLEYVGEELAQLPEGVGDLNDLCEAIRECQDGTERVSHIVRDLRTYSRAHEKEAVEAVDPVDCMRSTLRMAESHVRHRARVVTRWQQPVGMVATNCVRLGQVFLNVIINAAQAIEPGHAQENEISVTIGRSGPRIWVEIRDTGCGMSEAELARVTEPFFTTKAVGHGTGLGMSVSANLVEQMNGTVAISTELGVGTVVRIDIPAIVEDIAVVTKAGEVATRVLVIDDEPAVGRAFARILRECAVTVVQSGREGLERLATDGEYDAILCDLMMPDLTGMDVYEQLAVRQPDIAARMIFVTGGAFTERAATFLDRVPNSQLRKPFHPKALRTLVRGLNGAAATAGEPAVTGTATAAPR